MTAVFENEERRKQREHEEDIQRLRGLRPIDDEIGKLMHDFSCSDPDGMNNNDLADIARYYKETQEGVETMCKAMEEMRNKKRTGNYCT